MNRLKYAIGSEKDIPEQEDMPMEEFDDIKKMLGVPMDQESGIKSLKKKMASEPSSKADADSIARDLFGKGLDELNEIEEVQLQEYLDRLAFGPGYGDDTSYQDYMEDLEDGIISPDTTFNEWLQNNAPDPDMDLVRKRKAPSIKMASADTAMDEYKQYVYEMEEQDKIPMTFEQFMDQILAEARMGVMGGGILRANFNAGSAEIYEPERRERQAEIREEKATDIPSRRKARNLDLDIEKIKQLIKQSKNKKNSGIGSL